jgi:FAD/FMN-containing dehydrogenase
MYLQQCKRFQMIIRNKIVPAILEFMDRLCIDCVREEMHLDLPKNSGAMLLIEVDGNPDLVAHQARVIEELCGGAVPWRFERRRTQKARKGSGRRGGMCHRPFTN